MKIGEKEKAILAAKTKEFYQNVDRTLCSDFDLKVTQKLPEMWEKEYGVCDSYHKMIYLNFDKYIKESMTEKEYVMLAKGVNYHELAHFMFTVDNMREEESAELHNYLNILNDIRDENIFVSQMPVAGGYFRYIALRLIIKPAETSGETGKLITDPNNFVLVYGRRAYLPPDVIDRWERIFLAVNGEEITMKVKDIINKYMISIKPDETIKLAKQLRDLLGGAKLPGATPDFHSPSTWHRKKTPKKEDVKKVIERMEKEAAVAALPKKIHIRVVKSGASTIITDYGEI